MRAIDADRLGEVKFHSLPYTHITPSDVEAESYKRGWNDAIDSIIENAPTFEPRCETCEAFNKTRLLIPQPQRKKGKWILVKGSNGKDYHKCSECLHTQEITGVKNYCAVCGAEMCTPVETARDIVHTAIDNSVWSDTVDTAKMHKIVDDKYAEMEGQDERDI